MKTLFLGLTLLASISSFACEVPATITKTVFETQVESCHVADQELAGERRVLLSKVINEGRALTTEEVKRRNEISFERLDIADTLQDIALAYYYRK